MRKPVIWIVPVLLAVFLIWKCAGPDESGNDKFDTLTVKRGDIRVSVQATATIVPENQVDIKPPVAGRAEEVLVDMGKKVKQGEILAWMSSTERATMLDAARAQGEEELKYWKEIYKAAPLVAPLDGVIIARTLVPGQVVQATDTVYVLSDLLIAQADMDETDLAKVTMNQRAEIRLDSFPGKVMGGHVAQIAYRSTTVNNVTTYKVNVRFDEVPEFVRSGMTTSVNFIESEKKGVLILPSDAVQRTNDATTVLALVNNSSQPQSIPVTTGLDDGKNIEIVSGLNEGDKVARRAFELTPKKSGGISLIPSTRPRRQNSDRPPQ